MTWTSSNKGGNRSQKPLWGRRGPLHRSHIWRSDLHSTIFPWLMGIRNPKALKRKKTAHIMICSFTDSFTSSNLRFFVQFLELVHSCRWPGRKTSMAWKWRCSTRGMLRPGYSVWLGCTCTNMLQWWQFCDCYYIYACTWHRMCTSIALKVLKVHVSQNCTGEGETRRCVHVWSHTCICTLGTYIALNR